MQKSEEIDISLLLTEQRDVKIKKVRKYMKMIKLGQPLFPITVEYCHMGDVYFLFNGNHRSKASYFMNSNSVLCQVKPCTEFVCTSYRCAGQYNSISDLNMSKR